MRERDFADAVALLMKDFVAWHRLPDDDQLNDNFAGKHRSNANG